LAQLLDALAQQTSNVPVLRQKLGGIAREGTEKELNAVRAKASKLEEYKRNPPPQTVDGRRGQQPSYGAQTHPSQTDSYGGGAGLERGRPVTSLGPTSDAQRAQEEIFCNAALSGDAGAVQLLLTQGVNINCAQQGGWTALMNATLQGHAAVVELLVRAGADLNVKDNGGFTALMYAASYRRYPIAEALVKAGANLELTDNAGRNIHHYASQDLQVKEAINKGLAKPTQQLGAGTGTGVTGYPGFGTGFGTPTAFGTASYGFGGFGGLPTGTTTTGTTPTTATPAPTTGAVGYGFTAFPSGFRA